MKYSFLFPLALAVVLLGAGCSTTQTATVSTQTPQPATNQNSAPTTQAPAADAATKTYTLADVALHATQTDCWTVISGKVYNITGAIDQHPGGVDTIIKGCGIDGTSLFNGIKDGQGHPARAGENLGNYLIGTIK